MQESKIRHTNNNVSFMHESEVTTTQRLGKPVEMMKFSHATQNDILTLDEGKGVHNVEWLTDSVFGVHGSNDHRRNKAGFIVFWGICTQIFASHF